MEVFVFAMGVHLFWKNCWLERKAKFTDLIKTKSRPFTGTALFVSPDVRKI
jgi:hypothetical protein